jgi:hypothetical protein
VSTKGGADCSSAYYTNLHIVPFSVPAVLLLCLRNGVRLQSCCDVIVGRLGRKHHA